MRIDPAWQGEIQFHELLFGTWVSYICLVWLWEKVLRAPLPEWKYVLLVFFGACAFWINHYFLHAPFWWWLINSYTALYLVAWWYIAMRGQPRSFKWRVGALIGAVAYTIVYIAFEMLARLGVNYFGMHEFCVMTLSFFGFTGLIIWRGRRTARA